MKNTYNFARIIVILVIMVAVVLIALGIFGVFSSSETKNALEKVIGVGAVIIIGSIAVAVVANSKS